MSYEAYKYVQDQWTLIPSSFTTFKDAINFITGEVVQIECENSNFKVWIEQGGDINLYRLVNKE